MELLISFLTFNLRALYRVAKFVVTLPGLLITFVATATGIVPTIFGSWPIAASNVSQFVGYASTALQQLNGLIGHDGVASFVVGFFALDSLAAWFSAAFVLTIGVIAFLFTSVFCVILPLVIGVVTFRAILKVIQVGSGGLVDA